jgi:DNA-binding NarL/FixJ family response regulator
MLAVHACTAKTPVKPEGRHRMSSASPRVLICEDNPELLADYANVLAGEDRFRAVEKAPNGSQALAALRRERFDLLLLDLGLPDMSGLEVLRQMRRLQPHCEAIVVTVFCDERTVVEAIECGAHGYLLKQETAFNLVRSIDELLEGGSPITPAIARLLLQRMGGANGAASSPGVAAKPAAENDAKNDPKALLSERENDVLHMVAKGLSVQEVGDVLKLSSNTVKTYVRRIYRKLEVGSRQEAVYEARALGLLDGDADPAGRVHSGA